MSNVQIYSSCVASSRKQIFAFFKKAVWLEILVRYLLWYTNHVLHFTIIRRYHYILWWLTGRKNQNLCVYFVIQSAVFWNYNLRHGRQNFCEADILYVSHYVICKKHRLQLKHDCLIQDICIGPVPYHPLKSLDLISVRGYPLDSP